MFYPSRFRPSNFAMNLGDRVITQDPKTTEEMMDLGVTNPINWRAMGRYGYGQGVRASVAQNPLLNYLRGMY